MEQQAFTPSYRMYCVVPYYLMGMQQGIQGHHGGQRYAKTFKDDPIWNEYVEQHETLVYLNGGTSNTNIRKSTGTKGSMNVLLDDLNELGINLQTFYEEDQQDALTAIVFIADQRVWDKVAYPSFDPRVTGFSRKDALTNQYAMRLIAEAEVAYIKNLGGNQVYELQKLIRPLPRA